MPPAVEVENLTKRYDTTLALDEVSLTIEPGTCLALVGPNGAGKSTLMDCLATLIRPTSGQAWIDGVSIQDEPYHVRRRLGVAFQTPLTAKHLSAQEVLVHHARLYAVPRGKAKQRARELLDFVALTDRADDRVSTFSGGMKRRLDLARVLMTEPGILLLDEPTAGLDPRGRAALHKRLASLIREGTTVLLATHDLAEAERLADRVAILDEGSVLAEDAPQALAGAIGKQVIHIELPGPRKDEVSRLVASMSGVSVQEAGDAIELVLRPEAAPSPGRLIDVLDEEGLAYDAVTVREPSLGDVFFQLTGHAFEAERDAREANA